MMMPGWEHEGGVFMLDLSLNLGVPCVAVQLCGVMQSRQAGGYRLVS
jgi:hypothetical protein